MASVLAVAAPESAVGAATPAGADLRRYRARADLAAFAVGRRMHVEDPIASRYFELGAEEYFVLSRLDGRCDAGSLAAGFQRRFGVRPDPRRLAEIVAGLVAQGLVALDSADWGERLLARGRQAAHNERVRRYGNPLAVRLPGFDPELLLRLLEPAARVLARPALLAAAAAFVVTTALVVLVRFDELFARVDLRGLVLAPRDTVRLLVAVALVKTLHELGHALACRRLGGTCREIGVYVLCGAPCFYCDVTPMWRVPERWKRVAVGAAGMGVESVVAAAAFWLWRASEPGALHSACLHVAVVASVGTLLVNGNPLLRYDGYFILSDWLGLANLRERADRAFYRAAARRLLHLPQLVRSEDEPRWLPLYAAAAWCYRTTIVVGLLWLLHGLLAPVGLGFLAGAAALYALAALVGRPIVRFVRRLFEDAAAFSGPALFSGARGWLIVVGSALLIAAAAVVAWPWTYRVAGPAVVRAADARTVYAAASGRLVETAEAGAAVRAGDMLATLDNPGLVREAVRLRSDVARRRLEIEHSARRSIESPEAAEGAATLRLALATVEERLALVEGELERLTVRAPVDGVVAPVSTIVAPSRLARGDVDEAAGSALDATAMGRFVAAGTPLCVVGRSQRRELAVLIDESEIGLVAVGARAWVRAEGGEVLAGTVREASPVPLAAVPLELVAAGRVPIRAPGADHGQALADPSTGLPSAAPLEPLYLVRVTIDDDASWPLGTTAEVRIDGAPRSLAARAARWAVSTFHFRLKAAP